MNTLKLLAFVRLYITHIVQVLIKYYLNTDIAVIGQILSGFGSNFLPASFVPGLYRGRNNFGYWLAFLRPVAEAYLKSSRSRADGHPSMTRRSLEAVSTPSRKGADGLPKRSRTIAVCFLTCLAVINMFSLSAQTPRKDSGANGLIKVDPLLVGQKLPEEFWKREYLVYNNGDTTRQTLEAYRGKLLVLDFWATWCAICLGQMKEKDELFSRFPAEAKLIYVNPTQTKDTYTNVVKIQDRLAERSLSGKFQSIIEEDYLQQLFPNHIYPRYVWIGPRGDLIGLTLALSVTEGHIKDMLNLINPKDGKK